MADDDGLKWTVLLTKGGFGDSDVLRWEHVTCSSMAAADTAKEQAAKDSRDMGALGTISPDGWTALWTVPGHVGHNSSFEDV